MEEARNILWIYKKAANRLFFACVVLSFLSVSSNTPATFKQIPELQYATIIIDVMTGFILAVEACVKFKAHGYTKEEPPYLKNRWFIFDCVMVLYIWISVLLQAVEMGAGYDAMKNYPIGLVRVPRALIMLRVFRYFSFQFESGRLAIIVVRVGHQIGGVTLFLLFFLLLYGLLGVQLFGTSSYHCIANGTDTDNVTLSDLAIPDTWCSPGDKSMCPPNFHCSQLNLTMEERGYGGFDNIFTSIKTVYEAASQEGWVFLMYRNIDSYADWHGYLYFVTLIFFLAWLVKNVFIAVIIETFAEIRVQLHNLWGNSRCNHPSNATRVITNEGSSNTERWAMIDVNMKNTNKETLDTWRQALRSRWFHLTMLVVILLNVTISAFQPHADESEKLTGRPWTFFRIAELFFTLIFDVEAVMKVICLGIRGYFKRNMYKYEAFLALMTTIHTAYSFHPALRSFPVLRIIRLVKLSPTLENFVYKIFGPAKKIGLLVAFNLSILTLMSTISLQMLCYVEDLLIFSTFPWAFMSMFQIMTQEGWIDVMHAAMKAVGYKTYIPVSIFFILYHLFVTMVLMSLFVAVILDNLELDENLKRLKQLKVNEQSVDIKQPFRLRVFERFPNRPEMVRLSKMHGEFTLPRLRNSFLQQFVDLRFPLGHNVAAGHMTGLPAPFQSVFSPSSGIVASTALATRLAVQDDGIMNSSKMHTMLAEPGLPPEIKTHNFRDRMNWRRSTMRMEKIVECNNVSSTPVHSSKGGNTGRTAVNSGKRNLKKPTMLDPLMRDCLLQLESSLDSGLSSNASQHSKSLLSTQHVMRRERRPFRPNRRTFNDEKRQAEGDISSSDSLYNHKAQQEVDFKLIHVKRQQAILKRQRQEQELRENHPFFDTPLLLINRNSKFRKLCRLLVNAQYGKCKNKSTSDVTEQRPTQVIHDLLGLVSYLDWLMILITVASCSSMMLETTKMRIHHTPALQVTEYIFVVSMGCELLLKVFANGLFFTPKPTFKDLGGFLDATIFVVSLIFLCTLQSSTGHSWQFLMVLRCLRPLRIFKLVPQIKKVVVELFRGFKEIVMVGILLVALLFVFACFGVQVYGGNLAACNDDAIQTKEECTGIFMQHVWISNSLDLTLDPPGFMVPRVWTNPRNFNFDTIGSAMLALFEVLSLKGWVEVRDIIVERMGPMHSLYIHVFVFLGCMMGLTLFIGVVIANYNENKGTALLTVDQRRWEDLKSRLKIAQPLHLPPRPPGGIRAKMYDLAEHQYFKVMIACCVMMRTLLLSLKWESSSQYADYLMGTSVFFTFIFVWEVVIKIIGMTFMGMISSWRNRYDLLLTILEMAWVLIYFTSFGKSIIYSSGWILVALRFFSICGKHATLKMLLMTVSVSVYRSFFIIVAMFLLLLCYAYAGVVLFGNVKYGENIDRHANFATAPLAVAVLFRIVTGEDWNKIMHDCMIQAPRCTYSPNYWETDCGNVTAALIYFCSFYVIIAYIMLNILVAIIVENFSLFYTMDEDILLSYNDLHMFQVTWNTVDVKRKGAIDVKSVESVLRQLKGRLQIDTVRDHLLLKHMCYEMEKLGRRSTTGNRFNGTSTNGQTDENLSVTFHDVLMMTAYRSVDIRKSLQLEELLMREKLEAEIEEEVAKQTIRRWLEKCIRKNRARTRPVHLSTSVDNQVIQPSIIMSQADSSSVTNISSSNPNEEQGKGRDSDDADGNIDFSKTKFTKSGKHRRHGLWKPPPSYLPGALYTGRLPSLMVDGMAYDESNGHKNGYGKRQDRAKTTFPTDLDHWWSKPEDDSDEG